MSDEFTFDGDGPMGGEYTRLKMQEPDKMLGVKVAKQLTDMTREELISTIQDYQEMVSEIEEPLQKENQTPFGRAVRQILNKYVFGEKMTRPTENGVYQWRDTIVLIEAGRVYCVLGCNNYLGNLDDEKFNSGWVRRLAVEYDS